MSKTISPIMKQPTVATANDCDYGQPALGKESVQNLTRAQAQQTTIRNKTNRAMRHCQTAEVVLLLATSISGQRGERDGGGDPRGVQIIKQINRVNEDGTYTYGYEAADGSFKIETRDVLGNVKGMFGYVDNNGELKRVSYSAANGTGFQATDDYGPIPPHDLTTRRPILSYRPTPHQIQRIPPKRRVSTTPIYEYGTRRQQVQNLDDETTDSPARLPVRILVTKRPRGSVQVDSGEQESIDRNNVIRRQLGARDSQDVGGGARVPLPRDYGRYNPQVERPDQREIYRNMLLEQNNLKPDYPPLRPRYYPARAPPPEEEQQEQEYPEVPAVVPMVNRVLGAAPNSRARPRFARPPPSVVEESNYPVPAPFPRRSPYRGAFGQYPRGPQYDPYGPPLDYEALREEIMNYLIQYIQYRSRGYYNRPYAVGGYDPIGTGRLPVDGYYQPRIPPYQQDFYSRDRFYGGRPDDGLVGAPPVTPPPVLPQIRPSQVGPRPVLPPYAGFGPQVGPGYGPEPGYRTDFRGGYGGINPGYSPVGPAGYGPVGPAASYPFVNPNVQYSSSEDVSGTTTASTTTQTAEASETLSAFKERMDASDHHDASDIRPPSPGLIKLLLARPGGARTQLLRPTVRSVEILGTAASENRVTSSTTNRPVSSTTTEADPMIASP